MGCGLCTQKEQIKEQTEQPENKEQQVKEEPKVQPIQAAVEQINKKEIENQDKEIEIQKIRIKSQSSDFDEFSKKSISPKEQSPNIPRRHSGQQPQQMFHYNIHNKTKQENTQLPIFMAQHHSDIGMLSQINEQQYYIIIKQKTLFISDQLIEHHQLYSHRNLEDPNNTSIARQTAKFKSESEQSLQDQNENSDSLYKRSIDYPQQTESNFASMNEKVNQLSMISEQTENNNTYMCKIYEFINILIKNVFRHYYKQKSHIHNHRNKAFTFSGMMPLQTDTVKVRSTQQDNGKMNDTSREIKPNLSRKSYQSQESSSFVEQEIPIKRGSSRQQKKSLPSILERQGSQESLSQINLQDENKNTGRKNSNNSSQSNKKPSLQNTGFIKKLMYPTKQQINANNPQNFNVNLIDILMNQYQKQNNQELNKIISATSQTSQKKEKLQRQSSIQSISSPPISPMNQEYQSQQALKQKKLILSQKIKQKQLEQDREYAMKNPQLDLIEYLQNKTLMRQYNKIFQNTLNNTGSSFCQITQTNNNQNHLQSPYSINSFQEIDNIEIEDQSKYEFRFQSIDGSSYNDQDEIKEDSCSQEFRIIRKDNSGDLTLNSPDPDTNFINQSLLNNSENCQKKANSAMLPLDKTYSIDKSSSKVQIWSSDDATLKTMINQYLILKEIRKSDYGRCFIGYCTQKQIKVQIQEIQFSKIKDDQAIYHSVYFLKQISNLSTTQRILEILNNRQDSNM